MYQFTVIHIMVFWVVIPCNGVVGYQRPTEILSASQEGICSV